MTETKISPGPLRYRLYYWLMNAAFVWQVGAIIAFDIFGFKPSEHATWVIVASAVIGLGFEIIVMPLVIAVRFLRDEYAEMLWKQTIYQIASVLAIGFSLLFIFNVLLGIVYDLNSIDDIPDQAPFPLDWYFSAGFADTTYVRAIQKFWGHFTTVFPILFMFNRWRDSRAM